MTMSISSAPASIAWRVSASFRSRKVWPDGKAGGHARDEDARRPEGLLGVGDEGRVDADRRDVGIVGSPACGRIALAHSARILPGVSFPSSVVRSIIRIARSSAHSFDAALIERRRSESTRSSTPTWSTGVTRPRRLPSEPARASNERIELVGPFAGEATVPGRLDGGHRSAYLAAGPNAGQGRQAAPAVDQVVDEPGADLGRVLDPPERRAGAGQLVRLVGHPHQADGPAQASAGP